MSFDKILVIASMAVNLLLIVIAFFIKTFNSKGKKSTTAVKIFDVLKKIQSLIIDAEAHSNYTGNERFDYVMTGMTKYLMAEHITMEQDVITNLIENEIDLSNKVNTAETKKAVFYQDVSQDVSNDKTTVEIVSRETLETEQK